MSDEEEKEPKLQMHFFFEATICFLKQLVEATFLLKKQLQMHKLIEDGFIVC